MSTAEVAEALGLHPNTVRPHLERLREAGLVRIEKESQGTVGRPQHRYVISAAAPSPSGESPAYSALADMLASLASGLGAGAGEALETGRERAMRGAAPGAEPGPGACVPALVEALEKLGFDLSTVGDAANVTVSFTRCPFQDVAEAHPEVVCHLHQGLVEGLVERIGGAEVERFCTLSDREPCQVDLVVG